MLLPLLELLPVLLNFQLRGNSFLETLCDHCREWIDSCFASTSCSGSLGICRGSRLVPWLRTRLLLRLLLWLFLRLFAGFALDPGDLPHCCIHLSRGICWQPLIGSVLSEGDLAQGLFVCLDLAGLDGTFIRCADQLSELLSGRDDCLLLLLQLLGVLLDLGDLVSKEGLLALEVSRLRQDPRNSGWDLDIYFLFSLVDRFLL